MRKFGLLACLLITGCSLGNRIESFGKNFRETFATEYVRRTDPSDVVQDGYSGLRRIGIFQQKIELGLLTRREALDSLDEQDYDTAFLSVQNITRREAQDAFKQANPEVKLVEQFTNVNFVNNDR